MGRESKRRGGECILHFGMHKTGSSSIQQSLSGAGDLGSHYFLDLGTRMGNGGRPLVTMFARRPWAHHAYRQRGFGKDDVLRRLPADQARLAAEIAGAEGRTSIISAEVLSLFSEEEVRKTARGIRALVDSVRAVGYIRPPRAYMESRFQQRMQGSGRAGMDLEDLYPRYQRLEGLDKVLGRENVSMWKFAPAAFPEGDVVRDFCARLGIEIPEDRIRRVNESLSRPALSMLYAYRRFGPVFGVGTSAVRENRSLVEALRTVPGPKLRFSASFVEPVIEANTEDIAWIEARIGEKITDLDHEGGIRTGDDLLEIERGAITTFLEAIQVQNDVELPEPVANDLDTDPKAVARTMQACREAIGEKLSEDALRRREGRRSGESPASGGELEVQSVESSNELTTVTERGLVIAPNDRGQRPVVVQFKPTATPVDGPVEFATRVRGRHEDGPPVVLRLTLGDDGGSGETVLDEIEIDGTARRDWVVPLPNGDRKPSLRLICTTRAGEPTRGRARVRIGLPTIRAGTPVAP